MKKYFGNKLFSDAYLGINVVKSDGLGLFRYSDDTLAFIAAVEGGGDTLTTTEKAAVNKLVGELKIAGIWTTMDCLYPFVGGTSTSMRWNLRDVATNQITWYGGMVFGPQGIDGNRVNSGGNTGFSPSTAGYTEIAFGGFYTVMTNPTIQATGWYDMGAYDAVTTKDNMLSYGWLQPSTTYVNLGSSYVTQLAVPYGKSTVFVQNDGSTTQMYQNNTLQNNGAQTLELSTQTYGIGCSWRGSVYSPTARGFGTAFIASQSYNTAERTALNNAFINFNTTLSRA
tara:strand:+ start:49 stop:897 length:849 start_codon:yes stop_codon:yes gene_type:complete